MTFAVTPKKCARFCQSTCPLIDEPDEHLVHKGRRLQGVVSPLAPKLAGRHAPELRIDEWQ